MNRFLLLAATLAFSTTTLAVDVIIKKTSPHSVQDTLDRLEGIVKGKGFNVFARVDHAAGAEKVGESLRPTQLLIFGNPKAGTPLMNSAQSAGLDLPMRVAAWEDEEGKVWLAYNDPQCLVDRHGITDKAPLVEKMTGALKAFTDAATSQ